MSKNIAILVCGQIRRSALYMGDDYRFQDTFVKYILSKDVCENYNINIFFVVDKINKEKLYNIFDNFVKGLLQLDYENIKEPLNLNELDKKYLDYYNNRKKNTDKYPIVDLPRNSYIHKFYKLYCASKLMDDYEKINNIKHDYVMYLRPDTIFTTDLYPHIKRFEHENLEFMCALEYGYFGKYKIMNYLYDLILNYGEYNYGEILHDNCFTRNIRHHENFFCDINSNIIDYHNFSEKLWRCWSESPEVQVIEHILKYFYENNISYKKLSFFMPIYLSDNRKVQL
jgi:hypothetical protein